MHEGVEPQFKPFFLKKEETNRERPRPFHRCTCFCFSWIMRQQRSQQLSLCKSQQLGLPCMVPCQRRVLLKLLSCVFACILSKGREKTKEHGKVWCLALDMSLLFSLRVQIWAQQKKKNCWPSWEQCFLSTKLPASMLRGSLSKTRCDGNAVCLSGWLHLAMTQGFRPLLKRTRTPQFQVCFRGDSAFTFSSR